ncbi:SDR family oxidoreductase [soil metagenome]
MPSERFLVTGGAGFIGSHLVEALLKQGATVRVLDNFSTGQRENLAPFLNDLELIEGDLRDPEALARATVGVTYVLHQAALPSVPRSVKDPLTTHACNSTGTLNLLLACRDAGVQRVVYASSSSVYGDSDELPKRETMVQKPKSPYAVSKLTAEQYCQAFTQVYGLETVALRYFNVFGPRQDPNSPYAAVIARFIAGMLRGEAPVIQGDGFQSRDFTYVANNVKANLLAARTPGVAGQVFNIACGQRYTLLDLVDALNRILGTNIKPQHTEARTGDVRHSEAAIQAAKTHLNYAPEVEFPEGLARTVAWHLAQVEQAIPQ